MGGLSSPVYPQVNVQLPLGFSTQVAPTVERLFFSSGEGGLCEDGLAVFKATRGLLHVLTSSLCDMTGTGQYRWCDGRVV
jgi:hypothetical protein